MTTSSTSTPRTSQVRLKGVALPAEHGGWGFILEPVLLGLLVAPTLAGVCLGTAAFGVFLTRQPFKIALIDRRRGRRYARTIYAERFAAGYASAAALGLMGAVASAGTDLLLPLLFAVPFGLIQLIYDARSESRHWLPEVCGALALGMVASSIAVAGGWPLSTSLALWLMMAVRSVPSIAYVRTRLRLEKGHAVNTALPLALALSGLLSTLLLALPGLLPWTGVLAAALLLARAMYGLSAYRRSVPARIIGFQEIGFGLLTVLLTAAGF